MPPDMAKVSAKQNPYLRGVVDLAHSTGGTHVAWSEAKELHEALGSAIEERDAKQLRDRVEALT